MTDCDTCGQTQQNCECHIPENEKNSGLHELINMTGW